MEMPEAVPMGVAVPVATVMPAAAPHPMTMAQAVGQATAVRSFTRKLMGNEVYSVEIGGHDYESVSISSLSNPMNLKEKGVNDETWDVIRGIVADWQHRSMIPLTLYPLCHMTYCCCGACAICFLVGDSGRQAGTAHLADAINEQFSRANLPHALLAEVRRGHEGKSGTWLVVGRAV
jgi:hypothetical protein